MERTILIMVERHSCKYCMGVFYFRKTDLCANRNQLLSIWNSAVFL